MGSRSKLDRPQRHVRQTATAQNPSGGRLTLDQIRAGRRPLPEPDQPTMPAGTIVVDDEALLRDLRAMGQLIEEHRIDAMKAQYEAAKLHELLQYKVHDKYAVTLGPDQWTLDTEVGWLLPPPPTPDQPEKSEAGPDPAPAPATEEVPTDGSAAAELVESEPAEPESESEPTPRARRRPRTRALERAQQA